MSNFFDPRKYLHDAQSGATDALNWNDAGGYNPNFDLGTSGAQGGGSNHWGQSSGSGGFKPYLSSEVLVDDEGNFSSAASGGSGKSSTTVSGSSTVSLAPTIVGAAGGLHFQLNWDSSVAHAPTGFQAAIIAAATKYTRLYFNNELISINVGYGEVGGSAMGSGALGESESYGYLTNYATVRAGLLKDARYSLYQATADSTLSSTDPTHGKTFFMTSAETKTLGYVNASSTSVDGFIGLTNQYSLDYRTNLSGDKIGSNQYDAIAIAEHEISEVMGRIGILGTWSGYDAPIDLFRYSRNGVRDLTPTSGYFSINGGKTNLDTYNNPTNGGDAADWAAGLVGDSYGYGYAGHDAYLSSADLLENAALGYKPTATALADISQHKLV